MTKNGNKPASPEDFQAAEKKVRALAERLEELSDFEIAGLVKVLAKETSRKIFGGIACRVELETSAEVAVLWVRSLADSIEASARHRERKPGPPS